MEILRALATLCERSVPEHERVWRSLDIAPATAEDYTGLFVLSLPPYASIYLSDDGMLGGEARDRVAGFWRALRVDVPAEPDHLAALLGVAAALDDDGSAQARHARAVLLHEHLLSWLPAYLCKAGEIAPAPYRAWASMLHDALAGDVRPSAPFGLPVALRDAPPMPSAAGDDLQELLRAVLAPARSGLLIVRDDLVRAARTLGLGLRAGERRFILSAFFDQDVSAAAGWLRSQAEEWIERHRSNGLCDPAVRSYFIARAQATLELLQR